MKPRPTRLLTAAAALLMLASLPAVADEDSFIPEADPTLGVATRLVDGAGTGWETSPAVAGSAQYGAPTSGPDDSSLSMARQASVGSRSSCPARSHAGCRSR